MPYTEEEYSLEELREAASDADIEGRSSMNKAELIDALNADEGDTGDEFDGDVDNAANDADHILTEAPGHTGTGRPDPEGDDEEEEDVTETGPNDGAPADPATELETEADITIGVDGVTYPQEVTALPPFGHDGPNDRAEKAYLNKEDAEVFEDQDKHFGERSDKSDPFHVDTRRDDDAADF